MMPTISPILSSFLTECKETTRSFPPETVKHDQLVLSRTDADPRQVLDVGSFFHISELQTVQLIDRPICDQDDSLCALVKLVEFRNERREKNLPEWMAVLQVINGVVVRRVIIIFTMSGQVITLPFPIDAVRRPLIQEDAGCGHFQFHFRPLRPRYLAQNHESAPPIIKMLESPRRLLQRNRRRRPHDALPEVSRVAGVHELGLKVVDVRAHLLQTVRLDHRHQRPHPLVLLARAVAAPRLLNERHDPRNQLVSCPLQGKQGFGRADKDFCLSVFDVVAEFTLVHDHFDAVFVRTGMEVGPGELRDHFVALQESVVALAVGEACPAHAHVFDEAQVAHLVLDSFLVEGGRRLQLVGLDAANVVRFFAVEVLD
jgi:hypothetical protein